MNLHIITQQKFTDKLIELIEIYPKNSNLVYVYNANEGFECGSSFCVQLIKDFSEVNLSLLSDKDKLFIHGFYYREIIYFLVKNINRIKKNQLVLICWGGDIYDARFLLEDNKLHLRTRIVECLKKRIIKSCNIFMTFACADIEIIENYYGGTGKQFDCLYPTNADIPYLDKIRERKLHTNTYRVLLGNSATKSNQHIEALNALSKFSDENIEIICPLSYGEQQYAHDVIQHGRRLFGDKFVPILTYMDVKEYCDLLNEIDVAVFYHNRQQGTGNIEILSYLGKKLYIRSDTTTWKHYVIRDHCRFYDAKNLESLSFKQFVSVNDEDITNNYEYFRKIWDIRYIKSLWDDVMRYNEE